MQQRMLFETKSEEKFLSHEELIRCMDGAAIVSPWDFATAIGDTIFEKRQSVLLKINEVTSVMIRKGASGLFWVVCSPEVFTFFDNDTGFESNASLDDQISMGTKEISYRGMLSKRWRIYVDPSWEMSKMLIGVGSEVGDPKNYCKLQLSNFII